LDLEKNGFEESDFVRPEPPRRPMSWRQLQPVLLQSAGAVGLAATIMVVIAGTAQLGDRQAAPERLALAGTVHKPAATPETVVAAASPADAADDPGPRIVGSIPAAAPAPVAASPEPAPVPDPLVAKPAPRVIEQARTPASTPAAAAAGALVAGSAQAPTAETPAVQASAFWPKQAVDCPRDWKPGGGLRPLGAGECGEVATAPSTSEVAMRPAAEEPSAPAAKAAPTVAPKSRPAEAPAAKKTETKKASATKSTKTAQRPSDPAPNCGAGKRARWKFVEGEPTWYCKAST
jgi:hypothetical protein